MEEKKQNHQDCINKLNKLRYSIDGNADTAEQSDKSDITYSETQEMKRIRDTMSKTDSIQSLLKKAEHDVMILRKMEQQ